MICTRFGATIARFVRLAVVADVRRFERRPPDKHDRRRIADGMYVIAVLAAHEGKPEKEILADVAMLKADGGWTEIDDARLALPGARKEGSNDGT